MLNILSRPRLEKALIEFDEGRRMFGGVGKTCKSCQPPRRIFYDELDNLDLVKLPEDTSENLFILVMLLRERKSRKV